MNIGFQYQITLTHPTILLSEHYYRRLWLAARNVDIPRRDWLDALADAFRDFDGTIIQADGQPYELPLVDDVFDNDVHMRWMGYFLEADDSGFYPRIKARKIERLQLLDLYFHIKHPQIAKHFNR